MSLLRRASFFTTIAALRDLPADALAEVAFAGRSNAGKSSAINTITDHGRLAFVSKTPGRTQHLNYFLIDQGKFLVDLPGYGYAKAPEAVRGAWEGLLAPYLAERSVLKGLVLIMDCRHPLTELDVQMIEWFAPTEKPIHILLTKADKLQRSQQEKVLREVRAALAVLGERCSLQLFSSLKKTGVAEANAVLARWLDLAAPPAEPAAAPKRQLAPGEKRNPALAARLKERAAKKKAPGKGGAGG